ncbi:MAG: hypothetical protein RG740_05345, partial [Acholeplasmataceae bacterium]|nr:hypothetical protein [Acholeplasmataceae bacterium]
LTEKELSVLENEMTQKIDLLLATKEPNDINIAFVYYFLLFTFYRRNRVMNPLNDLISSYAQLFESIPFNEHILILYNALKPYQNSKRKELLNQAEKLANNETFSSHTGVLHHYAELCAEYYEFNIEELNQTMSQEQIKNAYLVAQEIVHIESNYAKFYVTLGRLASLNKDYNESYEAFSRALALEDVESARSTYSLYQMQALAVKKNFETSEFIHKQLNQQIEDFNDKMSKTKAENIRTIGLFAGLVTFILGNINIVLSGSQSTVQVMALFTSVFLIYFALVVLYSSIDTTNIKTKFSRYFPQFLILLTFLSGIMIIILLLTGVL